ncbi:MAG: GDP-L-fucose synthase [Campylobacter sp.]|uniref:GDP-L-fucose synthase family protein n=1 Tax=Campylobacter concisus TaxID=199 RepID=UPI000D30E843|nr:GDP-L-fucose synthase [Campylobacter concisus]MDO4874771.1 GDP-L-fucose synthase [Campylobacter sp.]
MKVYIAGHKGLVGSALFRRLTSDEVNFKIILRDKEELDLLNREAVFNFFKTQKPDWVFLAAAKVGGIYANSTFPVEFLLENTRVQNNVIEAAFENGVKKLLFLGSSCIYPKLAPQPIKEEYLLSSGLEKTNEAYAIAKIAGIKLCNSYNSEYGTDYISVMPTNLYGLNDNYHQQNAHALPMLLRRFHEAKINNKKEVSIWGSGTPMREFMFADDLADACVFLMKNKTSKEIGELINIGTGVDCTILELAQIIKKVVGYNGDIVLDRTKPDGTPRKLLDVSRLKALGWVAKTSLEDGLKKTYNDFLNNKNLRM